MLIKLIGALLSYNLVSQETRCLRVCMSDERLFFGEVQFEAFLQKLF